MARNKKDLFAKNLVKSKPSDEAIENFLSEDSNTASPQVDDAKKEVKKQPPAISEEEAEKEKGFHVKLPMRDYQRLKQESKETHIPIKYIMITAIRDYFKNKEKEANQ